MKVIRRHFLLSTAACLMVAGAPQFAKATPTPAYNFDWVERNLINDAIEAVTKIWDFEPIRGEAFGFMHWMGWTIGSAGELSKQIHVELYDKQNAVMWDRVCLWAQMNYALTKRLGDSSAAWRKWLTSYQPLPTYTVADYLLTGSPGNIRSILWDLETV